MPIKRRSRPPALSLLRGAILLLFVGVIAIGTLLQKQVVARIACIPDPELALLVRIGICGALLCIEVCCIALLLAVSFVQRDREQEID
ncbi:hypothetical protein ABNQ24_06975 [Ralstonia pseudosolanacearum]|uniref:hypothetical protein n=1 Tax=Ralstonia pseudosolanacearum TaxID=1310165 RepID=UPI00336A3F1E